MVKSLKNNKYYLQLLLHTNSPKQQKALLKTGTKEQLIALSEIALNVLNGNLPYLPQYGKKLKYKKEFLKILSKTKSADCRKIKLFIKNYKTIILLLKAVHPTLKQVFQST